MLFDPALRTLYKLAERVDGDELARVQEAIARRRSELDLADLGETPLSNAAAEARQHEGWARPSASRFRPAPRDQVPRLVRRAGEQKNRIAPPSS